MRPSTKAWGVLGAGVLAYDVLAPHGETLSELCHEAVELGGLRRLAVCAAIGATAFHLLDGFRRAGLPDPFGEFLNVVKHDRMGRQDEMPSHYMREDQSYRLQLRSD